MAHISVKSNHLITSFVVVIGGIFFASIIPLAALDNTSSKDSRILIVWMLLAWFVLAFLEGGRRLMRQYLAANLQKLTGNTLPNATHVLSKVARAWAHVERYLSIFKAFIIIPVIIFFWFLFCRDVIPLAKFSFTTQFYAYVAGVISYFLIARPVGIRVGRKINEFFDQHAARCTVCADGKAVVLDLQIKNMGKGKKQLPPITINFFELDVVQELSFREAEAAVSIIGPDIPLATQQFKDLLAYAKGDISRPLVYIEYASGSNLLLKGSEIFYIISPIAEDVQKVLVAFEKYKKL
jgi:hypothetical protein